MNTLGLYVQVPFCASKCSFCNFSSKVAPQSVFDAYCGALEGEITSLPLIYARDGIAISVFNFKVDTLYFGGGTPSLLGAERLQRLVHVLREHFQLTDSPEFTMEVTPGSADDAFCHAAQALGINRLSIGAQTFDDEELKSTGRLHTSEETRDLVRRARHAGFKNICLDLVAGLPLQTESSWLRSVHEALQLEPEHISIYLFEVDEKSRLGAEVLKEGTRYHASSVPNDDFMADAYESAVELLGRAGYIQYEISNFARPGRESRHNRKYWQMMPYVGLGAGAHSFDGARRWSNEAVVETYEQRMARGESPIRETRVLSAEEQLEEFFFLGLRQKDGVDLQVARRQWGETELHRWDAKLSALARDGWIEWRADRIVVPQDAYLVSNEIFQEFLLA